MPTSQLNTHFAPAISNVYAIKHIGKIRHQQNVCQTNKPNDNDAFIHLKVATVNSATHSDVNAYIEDKYTTTSIHKYKNK